VPGEYASDHFAPFDAVKASGLVVFSMRTVNFVGRSPFADAIAATLRITPAVRPNIFLFTLIPPFCLAIMIDSNRLLLD
jgi:hypothetical protein